MLSHIIYELFSPKCCLRNYDDENKSVLYNNRDGGGDRGMRRRGMKCNTKADVWNCIFEFYDMNERIDQLELGFSTTLKICIRLCKTLVPLEWASQLHKNNGSKQLRKYLLKSESSLQPNITLRSHLEKKKANSEIVFAMLSSLKSFQPRQEMKVCFFCTVIWSLNVMFVTWTTRLAMPNFLCSLTEKQQISEELKNDNALKST